MAEAAEQLREEATTEAAPPAPVYGHSLLLGRYQINPNAPLSELDTPSAKAYAVRDQSEAARQLFALICTPGLPPRLELMTFLRGNEIPGLLPLVEWGVVDWAPLSQRCLAVIYERPLGGRLAADAFGGSSRIDSHDVVRQVIEPAVQALSRLASRGFSHRAVRPDNMYFMDAEMREVVLGDCVTGPAAFDQPVVFETIERAMASPAGRGEGTAALDLYALGISLVFLLLGRNPTHNQGPDQLIQAKVERGTYNAVCGNERLPLLLIEPLRGLLGDNPESRWTFEDTQMWLAGARRSPSQHKASPKADNGLLFNGRDYFSPRTLAHVFSQNITDAAPVIRDGRLETWLRRQLLKADLADKVQAAVEIARAHQQDPLGGNDYLVAKVCILLDPAGPIRYKGFCFMPEGFGAALALEILQRGETQIPAEVLVRDIPAIWLGAQDNNRQWTAAVEMVFSQLRMYMQSTDMGQGIERCLYHANPGLACQSQLVVKDGMLDVERLLHALDQASKNIDTATRPIDRHIAAFIAARAEQDVMGYMRALTNPDERTATVAMLGLLSALQTKYGANDLFGLSSWVGGHLGPAIAHFRSQSTRREIEREMLRIVRLGSLPQLLDLVDNPAKLQRDRDNFAQAEIQYLAAQSEIERIESDDAARAKEAEESGRHAAAMASVILAMAIISLIFIVKTW